MKRAKEEGIHLETVLRGAEVYVRESHPVFQKCLESPHLNRCLHQLLWQNYLCELELRTRIRDKAAHSGIHVRREPPPIPETHPSAVVGRRVQIACHCKEEFL